MWGLFIQAIVNTTNINFLLSFFTTQYTNAYYCYSVKRQRTNKQMPQTDEDHLNIKIVTIPIEPLICLRTN